MKEQLDYIFLIYGLEFIIMAAVCFAFGRSKKQPMPWTWLALFGLTGGIAIWLRAIAMDQGDSPAFSSLRMCAAAASYLFLIEFARLGSTRLWSRSVGRWIYLPLLLLSCFEYRYGWADTWFRYSLGVTGGLWAAYVLLSARRLAQAADQKSGLTTAGIFTGLYSISLGLAMPTSLAVSSTVEYDWLLAHIGIPVQVVRGLLVLGLGIGVWQAMQASKRMPRIAYIWPLAAFALALLGGGWTLTELTSRAEQRQIVDSLHTECRLAAAAIDPTLIQGLGTVDDISKPQYQILRGRFLSMRRNNPQFRYIYLMVIRNGSIMFSADSEPLKSADYSPPGDEYFDAPGPLRSVCDGRRHVATCKYNDRWGSWISAFVPIKDDSGKVVGILGMDREFKSIAAEVAACRVLPMALTLLALILLASFGAAYARQKQSLDEITASREALRISEQRYHSLFDSMSEGFSLHSIILDDDGKPCDYECLEANKAFLKAVGLRAEEVVGHSARSVLPDVGQDWVEMYGKVALTGEPARFEKYIAEKQRYCLFVVFCPQPGQFAVLASDITDRKRMDQSLMEEKALSETIVTSLPGVFCMVDRQGKAVWWNPEYEELIAGENFRHGDYSPLSAVAEEDREHAVQTIRRVFAEGSGVLELRIWHSDGTLHYGYCSAVRVECGGEQYAIIFGVDITERKVAEQEISFKNTLLSIQQEASPDGTLVVDQDRNVLFYNKHFLELWGLDESMMSGRGEMILQRVFSVLCDAEYAHQRIETLIDHHNEVARDEVRLKDGRTFDSYTAPMFDEQGNYRGRAWYVRDITDRKQAEAQLHLHAAALNAANDLIAIMDPDGAIVAANDAFERQTGYPASQVIGCHISLLWPQSHNGRSLDRVWAAVSSGYSWAGEMQCVTRERSSYTADVSITPIPTEDGDVTHFVAIARNISEKKAYEDQLDYQAHHDALTDLPNRTAFSEELTAVIGDRRHRDERCAILFIDLDRFKLVNDTMGHQAGDSLLIDVASRLDSCLREDDMLARMGGDEFTVLLRHIKTPEEAGKVAYRMLEQVSQPFEIGDNRLVIGASIGISLYPDNANNVVGLLKSADAAMYRAKELGRNNCQFYSEELSQINLARVEMERDLRAALKQNQFQVYYQPIMDVRSREIIGAEALLRWNHPEKGMISPGLFVPVAEETGMILEMGEMVLRVACEQCRRWQDNGHGEMEVAVNVSPTQLRDAEFISEVLGAVSSAHLPTQCLKLEITETALAKNEYDEIDILSVLKELGVCICLDDFGIGYSSLSRLKELPIVQMKVDGSFIREIDRNPKDKAMTESIIAMAHNLGIRVTAEWIEDEEQLRTIQALHCDLAQGYLVSPALPADAFEQFLTNWEQTRRSLDQAA